MTEAVQLVADDVLSHTDDKESMTDAEFSRRLQNFSERYERKPDPSRLTKLTSKWRYYQGYLNTSDASVTPRDVRNPELQAYKQDALALVRQTRIELASPKASKPVPVTLSTLPRRPRCTEGHALALADLVPRQPRRLCDLEPRLKVQERVYSISAAFHANEVISHQAFGRGTVIVVNQNKITVLFAGGVTKLLIHKRSLS